MPHKHTKYLTELEMGGILFCFLVSILMKQLYALTDGHLIGVLFGAVNNSVWEQPKTLLLPYLLENTVALSARRSSLRRRTAAASLRSRREYRLFSRGCHVLFAVFAVALPLAAVSQKPLCALRAAALSLCQPVFQLHAVSAAARALPRRRNGHVRHHTDLYG